MTHNYNHDYKGFSIATKAIRSGSNPDKETYSVMPPIYPTSTYVQDYPGQPLDRYDYSRSDNPSRVRLQQALCDLENPNGDLELSALVTSSGLGAINLAILSLEPGSTIISGDDIYGGAYRLFLTVLSKSYNFVFVDTTDLANVRKAASENDNVSAIWIETPTNPILKITDVKGCADIAHENNALLIVDNTFMTPYFQQPFTLGADVVIHSLTKYLNGHSDVIGGAIITNNSDFIDNARYNSRTVGSVLSPFDAWLTLRGIKTLPVRMEKHQENAMKVADFLQSHPKVSKVLYPGFDKASLSQNTDKCKGGGMLSFYVDTDNVDELYQKICNLKVILMAESLGGVETLACIPALMTHASVPEDIKQKNGILPNMIRLSVGIEDCDDIIADLNTLLS